MKISRRALIATFVGTIGSVPIIRKFHSSKHLTFNFDACFSALIDAYVPSDEFPGAIDLEIDKHLIAKVKSNDDYVFAVHDTLQTINKMSVNQFHQAFHLIKLEQRLQILDLIFVKEFEDDNLMTQLLYLRNKTFTQFYVSQSAFTMLDYHPPSQGGYPDYDQFL